jgi:hypothetical protein
VNGATRDEVAEWDRIAKELANYRAESLEKIRDEMIRLWLLRADCYGVDEATVTPDDARRYFERELDPPPASELSRNFLAVVFRSPEWQTVGRYRSQIAGSHGNELRSYRWRGTGLLP